LNADDQILQRTENGRVHLPGGAGVTRANVIRNGSDIFCRTRRKSKLH
jgi:hypothetical protein